MSIGVDSEPARTAADPAPSDGRTPTAAGRLDQVMAQHRGIVRTIVQRDSDTANQAALVHADLQRLDLIELLKGAAGHPTN
jgi:DNA-binding FadR family transcriptional regulator